VFNHSEFPHESRKTFKQDLSELANCSAGMFSQCHVGYAGGQAYVRVLDGCQLDVSGSGSCLIAGYHDCRNFGLCAKERACLYSYVIMDCCGKSLCQGLGLLDISYKLSNMWIYVAHVSSPPYTRRE
jgi:hypothetical protein